MNVCIFYINLDRCPERNDMMINALDKLNYIRISGIDMNNITNLRSGTYDGMSYYIKPNLKFKPKQKTIAIILSHMRAIGEFIKQGDEVGIILEDDMTLQYITNWNEQINEIIKLAPDGWDIIKLHTSSPELIKKNINLSKKEILFNKIAPNELHSAGCYIINRACALSLYQKYLVNNIFIFPRENEYCVCECIIFNVPNVYMYTIPIICSLDQNYTCSKNYNVSDMQSNRLIHKYWEDEIGASTKIAIKTPQNRNKIGGINIRQMMMKKKNNI